MLTSLMSLVTMSTMVSGYGAVQDQRCEDCITVVAGLQEASLSNERFDVNDDTIENVHNGNIMQFDNATGDDPPEYLSRCWSWSSRDF